MKRTILYLCIIALVVTGNNLMAQDDRTSYDKSRTISEQLKNGTAPGFKFAPASKKEVTLKEPTAAEKSTSFGKQLKNGTLPGSNVAKGGGGTVSRPLSTNAKRSSTATTKLPSESASGTEVEKSPAKIQQPKLDQGGVKEELTVPAAVKPGKTSPAKPTGAAPKKKVAGKD